MATSKKKKSQQQRAREQTRQQAEKRRAGAGEGEGEGEGNGSAAERRAARRPTSTRAPVARPDDDRPARSTGRTTPKAASTTPSRSTGSAKGRVGRGSEPVADEAKPTVALLDRVRGADRDRTEFVLDPPAPGDLDWTRLVSIIGALLVVLMVLILRA